MSTALEVWRAIPQTPEMVAFFQGVFEVIGITIAETGETLTARVFPDRVEFSPGLPETADFLLPLRWENVENMVQHSADGVFDPQEAWRIVSVLFTPLTQETLKNPIMSNNIIRTLSGVESLIHVHLVAPDGVSVTCHSLIYVSGQWLVISGLHGKPGRTYRMTAEQSMDYQRRVFAATKANTFSGWQSFARWYAGWRSEVSVTA